MRWLVCLLAFPAHAETGAVIRVPYEPLTRELSEVIDFESFPKRLSPGINQDAPLYFEGASIGERFDGQVTLQEDGYDRLSGKAVAPLVLRPGVPGQNLTVSYIYFLTNQMQGLSAPGFPDRESGGEGAVAVLFEQDQRKLGFLVSAEGRPKTPMPHGWMTVAFLDRSGNVIDRLEIELDWGRKGYGFARTGDQQDIAGFTVENRDPGGIAIDDVIFDLLRAGS